MTAAQARAAPEETRVTNSELYQGKENRDRRARELKAMGFQVRRGSHRGQMLHPQYVHDADQGMRGQTGFGNTVYHRLWPVLYEVRWQ
jgi:hypothetical protein